MSRYLAGALQDAGPWLAGQAISLGDAGVGSLLISLYHCGETVPDSAPALKDDVQRFFAPDVVAGMIAEDVQIQCSMKYDSPLRACAA